jgi:hypothetical protein
MKTTALASIVFSAAALGAPPEIAPPPTQELLRRTGKAVELFWEQFAAVNCTESVSQVKLAKEGKQVYHQDSAFDYLALMHTSEGDLTVEESRVKVRTTEGKKRPPLLVTNGFSTLELIFHPYFQHDFEYSEPEKAPLDGKVAFRVKFRHLRGAPSPSCLRLRGRDYPLEWTGSALLDPSSGAVLQINAVLETSLEDLGLRALAAEVRYTPVHFRDTPEAFWLPAVATIDAETVEQRWRNIHQFSNYKHFSVETKSKTESSQ